MASDFLRERGLKLNTFSFDFVENATYFKSNSFQPEQDRPYVDKMLKAYNLNHTFLECDDSRLIGALFEAVCAKDMPGMTDVDASLLYFCRLVKQQNKVALTGECADEIFGGYPWFYREELLNAETFPGPGIYPQERCCSAMLFFPSWILKLLSVLVMKNRLPWCRILMGRLRKKSKDVK